MLKNKIYYWAPFIDHVATIKAVYNSVKSINGYSKNKYKGYIIDATGEWKNSNFFNQNEKLFLKLTNLNIIRTFSSYGFIRSRLKYIIIFFHCFFPLKNIIKQNKPQFLIVHLVTSLPIFLNLIYDFETKIILRISGKPKMNLIRKLFWKIALNKVFKITFPTLETLNYFKKLNIVDQKKIHLLYDPVIDVNFINQKKKEKISDTRIKKGQYYLAIGRLTKQKNFMLLIEYFIKSIKSNRNIKLVILGDGEEIRKLKNKIKEYNCEDYIFLLGFKKNVYKYLYNAKAFLLSSLWEDPGWVIVEAMFCDKFVISSNCPSGPKEIVDINKGLLFENKSIEDLAEKIEIFENLDEIKKKEIKVEAKKFTKNFTLLNHYKHLSKIIS